MLDCALAKALHAAVPGSSKLTRTVIVVGVLATLSTDSVGAVVSWVRTAATCARREAAEHRT